MRFQVLDRYKSCKVSITDSLATRFPYLLPVSKLQQLDKEWRKLSLVPLPFDMDPEAFWGRLSKIADGMEAPKFSTLSIFMQSLLCLPHANVDVGRVFSSIKTKMRN